MSDPSVPQYPGAPGGQPVPPAGAAPDPAYPGQPVAPMAAPPKKSKAGKIILIVLAVVLLLCIGGSAITYFAVRDTVGEVIEATQTRLVTPDTIAGRDLNADPEFQSLAEEMGAGLAADVPESTSSIGAFYGDIEQENLVMIAGVSGVMADPEQELADATEGDAMGLGMTNITDVDAGPKGGTARCGDADLEGIPGGVCVWSSRGALVLYVFYFSTGAEAGAALVEIRDAVEQTS
ncbi:hypothetical protein [Micromonospora sp. NBC_01813]|uniref:hypothetical protein n=1 Tax=Micromonospora sp. NBC_01813 TaxID=2975988 RepID=UPI002DD9C71D|nr:hypothetical protein [Micromonospora sp. NBC_01813]WSA06591.1 hypothetical protein OG958_20090 [Micromonospora sp. NBC_01813]